MAQTKPSGSTTASPKFPNADEAKENDLKYNILKTIVAHKEEMKSSLKEMEEKANKELKEINKSLKENQKKNQ